MNGWRLSAAVCSDRGHCRQQNEDNFYMNGLHSTSVRQQALERTRLQGEAEGLTQLFAVCDGMGGTEFGETAAQLCVERLEELHARLGSIHGEEIQKHIEQVLRAFTEQLSEIVRREAAQRNVQRMGTTMALAVVREGRLTALGVGDSRVYLLRANRLHQLTVDQTEAEHQLRAGRISPEQMCSHSGRHRLTSYLGQPGEQPMRPCIKRGIALTAGDMLLLCSDGLTDLVENERICKLALQSHNPKRIALALVEEALACGGKDNVTVLVVRVLKHR